MDLGFSDRSGVRSTRGHRRPRGSEGKGSTFGSGSAIWHGCDRTITCGRWVDQYDGLNQVPIFLISTQICMKMQKFANSYQKVVGLWCANCCERTGTCLCTGTGLDLVFVGSFRRSTRSHLGRDLPLVPGRRLCMGVTGLERAAFGSSSTMV